MKYKLIKDYNLFKNRKNTIISHAIHIAQTRIEIFLFEEIPPNEIILYKHTYNEDIELRFEKEKFKIESCDFKEKKIIISGKFSFENNYRIEIRGEHIDVILDPLIGGILDTYFDISGSKNFGTTFTENFVQFKLWSPPALVVEVLLYDSECKQISTKKRFFLTRQAKGIFKGKLPLKSVEYGDIKKCYFSYKISAYGRTTIGIDPYAKSIAAFNPETDYMPISAFVDLHDLKLQDYEYKNSAVISKQTNMIAYEVNVRDFTIQPGAVSKEIAGTFKGFEQKINYLSELGITHVQLMPVSKCLTLNEKNRDFTGKNSLESNYNWGYDVLNFFVPEGRYSTDVKNPTTRIIEFKELVNKLHQKEIGVIIDVVFNHTLACETFENIAPGCYYRLNEDFSISEVTGAGAGLESRRKAVRKLFIDILLYFVSEFKVDGFRFDLMSFHDIETMKEIRETVGFAYNPDNIYDLILQGEAWEFTDLPAKLSFSKINHLREDKSDLQIAMFNDIFRDSACGTHHSYGAIQGNLSELSKLASGISGACYNFNPESFPFEKESFFNGYNSFAQNPGNCLNYLSIHDGLTLWDKINLSINDKSGRKRLQLMKLAANLLFTSQGKIIWHGGDEILRSKPLADFDKTKHRALTSEFVDEEENTVYFHENSYRSCDYTNMFRWERLTNEFSELAQEMSEHVKKLIQIRKTLSEFWYETVEELNKNFSFFPKTTPDSNSLNINSFEDQKLKKLKIIFINGIKNSKMYLTGEIHKEEQNPCSNPYFIDFDNDGTGFIEFSKKEIKNFDLRKWDFSNRLNFKLVKTPGQWDYFEEYYSENGNNSISPASIDKNFEVIIDLAQKDFWNAPVQTQYQQEYIMYSMNNARNNKSGYKKIFIIHNFSETNLNIDLPTTGKILELISGISEKNKKISIESKSSKILGVLD